MVQTYIGQAWFFRTYWGTDYKYDRRFAQGLQGDLENDVKMQLGGAVARLLGDGSAEPVLSGAEGLTAGLDDPPRQRRLGAGAEWGGTQAGLPGKAFAKVLHDVRTGESSGGPFRR